MAETRPSPQSPPPAAPQKRAWHLRALYWFAAIVGSLVLLFAMAVVAITHWDWNSARPWVSQKVSEATGRSFHINGNLTAEWHWPQLLEHSWRRWIPGVTLRAEGLSLGNPEGFAIEEEGPDAPDRRAPSTLPPVPRKQPPARPSEVEELAANSAPPSVAARSSEDEEQDGDAERSERADAEDAERLLAREKTDATIDSPPRPPQTMGTIASASATVRLLPLLQRTIALDTVVLTAPDIVLGRNAEGINNWTFTSRQSSAGGWNLSLGQLIVRGGWLGYSDGIKDLALRARIDTFRPDEIDGDGRYGVHVALQGRYGKARVEGEGLAGPILSLRRKVVNYPLHIRARAGSLRAEAQGVLANPRELSGMDLQVSLQGSSMADLFDLTGVVLPNTPAFKTHGRLLGSLEPGHVVWEYRDFDGVVGSSDLHGSLTYTAAKPRPRLEGRMLSKKLRLTDLGPVIGKTSSEAAQLARKGKVLPDTAFDTARWSAMDMDVAFTGERIIRPASLPIEDLSTRAVLQAGELTLSPLRFGVAKGRIHADVVMDSREKPMKVKLNGSADGLQLSALFPQVELMHKSFGRLDGGISLVAHGSSVAAMLGSSHGEAKLFIRDGTFSKQLLDLAALNLGSVIATKLFGENREVQLRCAVADFALNNGVAQTRVAKMSTEEAIVEVTGLVNLHDELLDLRVKPDSLKWKFFSLRTPLYVQGSFANPKVGVETGPLLLRAGAAVAAAVVAPVALALVPVTVPAAQDDADCKQLLALAQ